MELLSTNIYSHSFNGKNAFQFPDRCTGIELRFVELNTVLAGKEILTDQKRSFHDFTLR